MTMLISLNYILMIENSFIHESVPIWRQERPREARKTAPGEVWSVLTAAVAAAACRQRVVVLNKRVPRLNTSVGVWVSGGPSLCGAVGPGSTRASCLRSRPSCGRPNLPAEDLQPSFTFLLRFCYTFVPQLHSQPILWRKWPENTNSSRHGRSRAWRIQ